MLRQCVSEGSLFKPPAMDVLLAYHINRDAWEKREEEYESDQAEIRWIIEESERLFGRGSWNLRGILLVVRYTGNGLGKVVGELSHVLEDLGCRKSMLGDSLLACIHMR